MVYNWKEGSRWGGSAQEIGERLEKIGAAGGGTITPLAVVDDARQEDSPLHRNFEWDDVKAAEAHRIHTARQLIDSVVVSFADEVRDAPKTPMRAFSHVRDDLTGAPAYMSTIDAMRSPQMRAQIVARAKAELDGWRRRYRHYQELANAVAVVSDVAESIAA